MTPDTPSNSRKNVLLKSDLAFKIVFARDTPECKAALTGLLQQILDIKIDELIYKNPINIHENLELKQTAYDISVSINGKTNCEVEIQLCNHPGFKNRLIYYGGLLIPNSLYAQGVYTNVKKSIVICFTNFNLFDNVSDFRSKFIMMNPENNMVLSNTFEIQIFEMTKIATDKPVEQMSELEKWIFYLMYSGENKYNEKLQEIINESEEISMAQNIFNRAKFNEDEYFKMIDRMKAQYDEEAFMNSLIKDGEEKATVRLIGNLYKKNFPISTIAECAELPESEVARIIATLPQRGSEHD